MDAILPSTPLTYGQLIKRSLTLYVASFSKVILLAVLLSIVVFIPRLLSDVIGHDPFLNLPLLSPHRLWGVLINLIGLAFFVAIIWHSYCVARNVHEPLLEDMVIGAKKTAYVLVAALIQNALILAMIAIIFGLQLVLFQYHLLFFDNIGSVLLTGLIFIGQFMLLLYMSVLFIFFIPLIAIENKGIIISLEKSVLLTWNHWWRVFSTQLTPWIFYLLALMVIKYILNIDIHIYLIKQTPHPIWISILHVILFALFIPWVAMLLLLQLKDLEKRRELLHKP